MNFFPIPELDPSDKIQCQDNGVVILPTRAKTAPLNPNGAYRHMPSDPEPGTHLQFRAGHDEDAWAEFQLTHNGGFEYKKRYEFHVTVKTNAEQKVHLKLTRGQGEDQAVFEKTLTVPNTNGEWQDTPVTALQMKIGGQEPITMRITVSKDWTGTVFAMKRFTFIPPGAIDDAKYSATWFITLRSVLLEKAQAKIPELGNTDALKEVSIALQEAHKAHDDDLVNTKLDECLDVALPLLEVLDSHLESLGDLDDGDEDQAFLQCMVSLQSTPMKLADFCRGSDGNTSLLMDFLNDEDDDTMKTMLMNGGAKAGFYGHALGIFQQIKEEKQSEEEHAVLDRLAMAVAMELCEPLAHLDDPDHFIDPLERYLYYERAFLEGELDPAFEHLTIWELRMVVNADASDEHIAWARRMLMDYRPDIASTDKQEMRYCKLVESDVKYKKPQWTSSPKTYQQIVARGGMCGERAALGRFLCKAHGIPTWGVTQWGHDGLAKWTPQGWVFALGPPNKGWWGSRSAFDFIYETKIRKAENAESYFRKVELLHAFGMMAGEKQTNSIPHPDNPWSALALMQRKRLGDIEEPEELVHPPNKMLSNVSVLQQREDPESESIMVEEGDVLFIPVYSRTSEKKAMWMKSFAGGRQMYVRQEWEAVYTLTSAQVPTRQKYKLTLNIASVHDNDPSPFLLTVTTTADGVDPNTTAVSIPFIYTTGIWQETEPVELELGGGQEVLTLTRQMPCDAVSIKELKLTPV